MITLKEFFTYTHLFRPTTDPMPYGLYFFALFGLSIIISLVLYFLASKKKIKFQKNFYRHLADALFYLPILMILYIFVRRGGLQMMTQRMIFLLLGLSWLIWLIYLLYYRLAVVSRLYLELSKKKKEEKYLRNGKN